MPQEGGMPYWKMPCPGHLQIINVQIFFSWKCQGQVPWFPSPWHDPILFYSANPDPYILKNAYIFLEKLPSKISVFTFLFKYIFLVQKSNLKNGTQNLAFTARKPPFEGP